MVCVKDTWGYASNCIPSKGKRGVWWRLASEWWWLRWARRSSGDGAPRGDRREKASERKRARGKERESRGGGLGFKRGFECVREREHVGREVGYSKRKRGERD